MTRGYRWDPPYWEDAPTKTHSFEISEYPCGGYGALLAVGFLLSFVATVGTLLLVL